MSDYATQIREWIQGGKSVQDVSDQTGLPRRTIIDAYTGRALVGVPAPAVAADPVTPPAKPRARRAKPAATPTPPVCTCTHRHEINGYLWAYRDDLGWHSADDRHAPQPERSKAS